MANADMYKSAAKMAYSSNPEQKKEASKIASKLAYADNPDKKKEASKIASKLAYADNPDKKKEASKIAYADNPDKKKEASKIAYADNPDKKKEASKIASKLAYADNPDKKKEASKIASKTAYVENPGKKKEASKMAYADDRETKRKASKKAYEENAEKRKNEFKDNYSEHREEICSMKRDQYVLRAPNEGLVNTFVDNLLSEFLLNADLKVCLTTKLHDHFKSYAEKLSKKMECVTACRLASRNLVHHVLELRKLNAGKFIKHVRDVNTLTIDSVMDFGDKQHSMHAEPYFYDTGYRYAFQPTRLSIDKNNRCLFVENLSPNPEEFICDEPIPLDINGRAHICDGLGCSYVCRTVSDRDIECILDIKQAFTKSLAQV
ncbi:axoneme-associated protein mst101(2)-like [Dysidea avara]|uniref:axoneme-associated protein mst101(2)-like n=1 Tax=Dysidea avara TaxID=196820 RepID=UPI00331D0A49